jgi:hypothetical protein
MIFLIESTPTFGQTLVKAQSNPSQPPMSLNLLENFCRVLQISPKHFNFSQYKNLSTFSRDTTLLLGGISKLECKMVKTWSTTAEHYSPVLGKTSSLLAVHAPTIAQNICRPLQKMFSHSSSTTLLLDEVELLFMFLGFEEVK